MLDDDSEKQINGKIVFMTMYANILDGVVLFLCLTLVAPTMTHYLHLLSHQFDIYVNA